MPSAHCSGGTIKILREQEKHTTIPCAPRILLKRNSLDPEKTRTTTHSSRTSSTGKENRVDLVLRCCRWDHKIVHHECKWRTRVQVSPVRLQGIGFLLARARLIVKSSLRSPDLENSPRENLIGGEALLNGAQYICGFGVGLTLKFTRGVQFLIFTY